MNIKARFFAKPFDIFKEEVVKFGNDGYYIYQGVIYYGNRFGIFNVSGQRLFRY